VTPLAKLLEAALFASATPVPVDALRAMAAHADDTETTLESALEELRLHYDTDGHGVELVQVAGGWQVLTRPEYTEAIERAQLAGAILKSLHERGLIDVVGRGEGLGRPLLYGTTPSFLEQFALRHLEELPRADELAIALRAPRQATPPGGVPAPATKGNGEAPPRAD